jgi:hypothetical protein
LVGLKQGEHLQRFQDRLYLRAVANAKQPKRGPRRVKKPKKKPKNEPKKGSKKGPKKGPKTGPRKAKNSESESPRMTNLIALAETLGVKRGFYERRVKSKPVKEYDGSPFSDDEGRTWGAALQRARCEGAS